MKKIIIASILSVYTLSIGVSQNNTQGHFLVEFAKFTPPVQDLVKSFEGFPAELFLANDVKGTEHYLEDYKGKKVILWFWSVESTKALEQISAMTLLQDRNRDHLKIVSFAKEPKSKVLEYLRQYPMEIDVIPNGEVFGQMAYGADMGNPRMFVIDEFGIIKIALPEEAFEDNTNLLVSLEAILNGLQGK
jgi:peroxiredoxin